MQQYRLVEALGITVVPVPDLRGKVVLVREQAVALVRPDLDDETACRAVDWLIQEAAALPHPC